MVNITKNMCTGCTSCKNVCPKKCIKMEPDKEGFIYPVIDKNQCIKCGLCDTVCPVLLSENNLKVNKIKNGFIFQNTDKQVLKESTSGGFFTAIAKWVIEKEGVCYGAAYDSNFVLKHISVNNLDDLQKFRNSKYVQSDCGQTFVKCKEYLENGKIVLYSGTPCQIAGLTSYLKKDYENLIKCDFACHGVPSPLLFQKYIQWIGGVDKIKNIIFREKYRDYYQGMMAIEYKNGRIKRTEKYGSPMLNLFFNDICSRPSCYNCNFKSVDRVSDFTMFDSWHGFRHDKSFGKLGTTAVIARSEKALKIMEELSKNNKCITADYQKLIKDDGAMMTQSVRENPLRKDFFEDLATLDFETVVNHYCGMNFKRKLVIALKHLLVKIGLFGLWVQFKLK